MKLSEMIAKIGDNKVMFQNLDDDTVNMRKRVDGQSEITFGTSMTFGVGETEKLGLVVWLDRKEVEKLVKEKS